MTQTQFFPFSNNPANNDSIAGLFRLILRKWLQNTDNQLPAQVVAYSRATNVAQVQPLIFEVTTTGMQVLRAQIAAVPVRMFGGNGTVLSSNLTAGDLGWIRASDRDISLFRQSWKNAPPNTKRLHSFEDAVFEPDTMHGVTIPSAYTNNMTIQSLDGTSCAAFNTANNVVDCQSTTKAFKVPSMSTAQRDAIASPEGGQIVYVNDFTPEPKFSFYVTGVGWS